MAHRDSNRGRAAIPTYPAACGRSCIAICTVSRNSSATRHFLWRPQLRDPADGLVLEAAVNRRAAAMSPSTGAIPARFGIDLLTPAEAPKLSGGSDFRFQTEAVPGAAGGPELSKFVL